MYTEGFVDDGLEIWQLLDLLRVCDRVVFMSEGLVQFLLKLGLNTRISSEVVSNRT